MSACGSLSSLASWELKEFDWESREGFAAPIDSDSDFGDEHDCKTAEEASEILFDYLVSLAHSGAKVSSKTIC